MTKAEQSGDRQARRLDAYHEAGHASMFWFFQQENFLKQVRLDEDGGLTTGKPLVYDLDIKHARATDRTKKAKDRTKKKAKMLVMHTLAGPCAERRCDREWYDGDLEELYQWLSDGLERVTDENDSRPSVRAEDDMTSAVGVAWELGFPMNGKKISKFLELCAEWTFEAVTSERMWKVIDTLAQKVESDTRIPGKDAWDIMKQAWGNDSDPPIYQPPWNERFAGLIERKKASEPSAADTEG